MHFSVDERAVHALTGGRTFDASLPTVVFLHGAGMDASVWALQSRWLAHHGYAVLALDMPGHGRSEGPVLSTVGAMADWVVRVLDAVKVQTAALVGHSMGSLVALATAARHVARVKRLALIGTALEMKVGPELLVMASDNPSDAVAMVNLWGHGPRAGLGGGETPGTWMVGAGQRLLERARPGVLASDLAACHAFSSAAIARSIRQAVLILQGTHDLMTPLKGARALADALPCAHFEPVATAGHMLMIEEGGRVLTELALFLADEPILESLKTPAEVRP